MLIALKAMNFILSHILFVNFTIMFHLFIAVVLLAFNESEYPTLESSMTVEVCVVMVLAPAGGLECAIIAALGLQDGAAGKSKEGVTEFLPVT